MNKMKIIAINIISLLLLVTVSCAQQKASPAATAEGSINGVDVKVDYHQPSAKGRKVMGELVPFGKVWRTGANDATTVELSEDVKIEGKTLAKGKYALFTIPNEGSWVIIFNKTQKQWGAYDYKEAEDALRVTVRPSKTEEFVESFVINIVDNSVEMKWENTAVKFSIAK
jgi:hypothetical protein